MAGSSFLDLLIAALGGGVSANVIDHLWSELKERRTSRRTVEHLVETHLDPILKTADELFGKLRDLAIRDFSDVKDGDEDQPLGTGRRMLAILALVIFLLSFMPTPIGVAFVQ